jgi:hypothetical protein
MNPESSIPDAWPPEEPAPPAIGGGGLVVPLFPLPNLFLYPGTLMPLHIFEPRYRQMVEDCLDGPGRIAVGAVLQSHHDQLEGAPPVFPVAGLGEIAKHERLPDGRFLIVLVGLARAGIREVASGRSYRRVEAHPLREVPPSKREDPLLRQKLREALLARAPELATKLSEHLPVGHLADLLILRMSLPQTNVEDLYARLDVADRATRALVEHARRPPQKEP